MTARRGVAAVVALAAAWPLSAQDALPLPDPEPFYATTRANLNRAQQAQSDFAYRERRSELHLNPFGRMGTGGTVVYDVRPLASGGSERRLLERDGVPVTDAALERREPRARRQDRRSAIDDTASVLRFTIDRRGREHGRDVIAVHFEPRPGAAPETREGSLARQFAGTVFVDEAAHEVLRVEATAVDDLSYGFGMLARLGKGTTVKVTRERVEPDLWLPTATRLTGRGRALLFRRLEIDQVIEWFNYRRVGS